MKRLIYVLILLSILSACTSINSNVQTIQGSGTVVMIERSIENFRSIQVNMGAELLLVQGEEASLSIEAEANLIDYIETSTNNSRLVVKTPDNVSIQSNHPIRLLVTFTSLDEIEIFGSSNITAENLNLEMLAIRFSGSGSTFMTGIVNEQIIEIQGQATINNSELVSQSVSVDISGSGTINVNVTETLSVKVAGMAVIRYFGNPILSQDISGTATITQQGQS